jgi:hypothetical protein
MPRRKRTPEAEWILCTNAVQMEQMPNPREMLGMNQPGPTILQTMFEGISKRM